MIKQFGAALTLAFTVALTFPAAAHHSFAVYDLTQTKTAAGTIKEFNFGAPHSTATFTIMGPDGKSQNLTLQGAAPAALSRAGFKPRDFSKGTQVEISWHPVRTGGPEGAMIMLKLSDGRVFNDEESQAVLNRPRPQ